MEQVDLSEEVKKCLSLAQSFYADTKVMKDVQHMGTLLASNCQKVCIGPSFHLHTSESDIAKMSIPLASQNPLEERMNSEEEEFETVIYNGPQQPITFTEVTRDGDGLALRKKNSPRTNLTPMNVKLAQVSAKYNGLLSPDFFCSSSETSSAASAREESSSSSQSSTSDSVTNSVVKRPFNFPKTETTHKENNEGLSIKLQRMEIVGEVKEESSELQLEEFPKKFIEKDGFRLGIQPGDFYRSSAGPFIYVVLPHRCKYEILVTNSNAVDCDVDLYVNGIGVYALRLLAGESQLVDGPVYSEGAFALFRTNDVPSNLDVSEGDPGHGTVKAVFTPAKQTTARYRASSEPARDFPQCELLDLIEGHGEEQKKRSFTTSDQEALERSLNMDQVQEGVTLLKGKKKKRNVVPAPHMETDISKRVILQLRLIASSTNEVAATDEETYCIEPPPIPVRKKA